MDIAQRIVENQNHSDYQIYLGLSSFSFGAPNTSPSPQDISKSISPLTQNHSADHTPRPSLALPPTSLPPPPPRRQRQQQQQQQQQQFEDHISDSDDPPTELIYSDTASQHTFGGHGLNSSSASLSSLDTSSQHSQTGFSSDEEAAAMIYQGDRIPEPSPVTFASLDGDDDDDDPTSISSLIPPDQFYRRRRSLPMAIPGANTANADAINFDVIDAEGALRDREPSIATLRRPSRSLDDDMRALNIGLGAAGASEPLSRGDWATLEARTDDGQDAYENAGMNIGYILSGQDIALSRRSSDALSFAQPVRRSSQANHQLAFGWGWNGPVRRPSTATVATGLDDTFTRHLRGWDEDYGTQKGFWSFKREKADGNSPNPTTTNATSSSCGSKAS